MISDAYTKADIAATYREVGVKRGQTVYVTSDLGRLMKFEIPGKSAILEAHLDVLQDLVGGHGNIVVPTASMQICNTEIPFDLAATPSHQVGIFSEFIRTRAGALRSFHPFVSYTALGHDKRAFTEDVSRHAFGPETPEARLIEADALCLVVGQQPNLTCSTVHHMELIMGVPYRYTKEYLHPVVRSGVTVEECFYQHVWYREVDLSRDLNQKIFSRFAANYTLKHKPLGRGMVHSYAIRDFAACCQRMFAEDIYSWCAEPPTIRPYRL